jgi:hypothetical protein
MAYKIFMKHKYSGLLEEADEETYATKREAKEALDEFITDFLEGADVLEMADESYLDPDDYEFLIEKV